MLAGVWGAERGRWAWSCCQLGVASRTQTPLETVTAGTHVWSQLWGCWLSDLLSVVFLCFHAGGYRCTKSGVYWTHSLVSWFATYQDTHVLIIVISHGSVGPQTPVFYPKLWGREVQEGCWARGAQGTWWAVSHGLAKLPQEDPVVLGRGETTPRAAVLLTDRRWLDAGDSSEGLFLWEVISRRLSWALNDATSPGQCCWSAKVSGHSDSWPEGWQGALDSTGHLSPLTSDGDSFSLAK